MDQNSDRIKIAVVGQDGQELLYRIKPQMSLVSLLQAYCEKKQLDFKEVRFYFNGKNIKKKDTPAMLGMEQNDKIDAMIQMNGGGDKNLQILKQPRK